MGDRINVDLIRRDSDAFPAPRDADLLLVPLRPAVIELIEGAPTGGADSDSRDLQRSPGPPLPLVPPQLVVLRTQIKGRPSVGVDLVYVFWTQQAQEPGVDPAEVSGPRGECDTLVQDHLARIGFRAKSTQVQLRSLSGS